MTKVNRISAVEESRYGIYVWEYQSKWLSDDEGNYLSMPSEKGDKVKLEAFKKYAHGLLQDIGETPGGRPVFLSGFRQVTDEQYEEQKARAAAGLTPDPFDMGAIQDDLKEMKFNK